MTITDSDIREWMDDNMFFRETGAHDHPHGPEIDIWDAGRHLDMGPIEIKRYGDGDCYLTMFRGTERQHQIPIRAEDAWTLAAFLMGYFYGRGDDAE